MKKLMLLSLLFFGIQIQATAQTEKYASLAYGEWLYDGTSKGFNSKILLMDDGTFEWYSQKDGEEEQVSKGTFIVENDALKMTYTESGKTWNYSIETLDSEMLVFRWVENVFRYKRAGS